MSGERDQLDGVTRVGYIDLSEPGMTIETDISATRAPADQSKAQARSQSNGPARRTRSASFPPHTNSSVGAFMACPRRYWWAYNLGIRKDRDGRSLTVGKAYHAALESLNNGGTIEQATTLARHADLDEVDRELAACMVAGWHWRWSEAPAFRKILAVERVFEFKPFKGAKFSVAGKIDVIGELEDGRVAVGEYKTTVEDVSPGSDYWRRLLIDRQISGYVLGARAIGFPAETVLYDAARLPGIRPRLLSRKSDERESMGQFAARLMESIADKPEFYYGRQEISRLDADLEEWRDDMAQVAGMIATARKAGRWPRNTDSCRRWGTCPYFGPCSASYDPTISGVPSGYVRVDDVNVELTVNGSEPDDTDTNQSE